MKYKKVFLKIQTFQGLLCKIVNSNEPKTNASLPENEWKLIQKYYTKLSRNQFTTKNQLQSFFLS